MWVEKRLRSDELERMRSEIEGTMNSLVELGDREFDRLFEEGKRE